MRTNERTKQRGRRSRIKRWIVLRRLRWQSWSAAPNTARRARCNHSANRKDEKERNAGRTLTWSKSHHKQNAHTHTTRVRSQKRRDPRWEGKRAMKKKSNARRGTAGSQRWKFDESIGRLSKAGVGGHEWEANGCWDSDWRLFAIKTPVEIMMAIGQ